MLQVPPGVQHRSDSLAHLCGVGKYGVEDRTLVIATMASCLALLVKKKDNKFYHDYNGDTKGNVYRGSHSVLITTEQHSAC